MRSFEITFPAGMKVLTANVVRATHWRKYHGTIKEWRETACLLSRDIPPLQQVKIKAIYYAPDNRRRDTANVYPTVKGAIDGIVDAGVLPDDSDKYVRSVELARGDRNIKGGQLVIEIMEVDNGGNGLRARYCRPVCLWEYPAWHHVELSRNVTW